MFQIALQKFFRLKKLKKLWRKHMLLVIVEKIVGMSKCSKRV